MSATGFLLISTLYSDRDIFELDGFHQFVGNSSVTIKRWPIKDGRIHGTIMKIREEAITFTYI